MTQFSALFIDPPPAQIHLTTTATLPRFVAENHLDRLERKASGSFGVVSLRWLRSDFDHNTHQNYQQAYQRLFEVLQEVQDTQDLIFASNSHELGITLSRESTHDIHRVIRDLLHNIQRQKIETIEQKKRPIGSILNLQFGWATNSLKAKGRDVLFTAEQRSYHQYGFV